MADYATINTGRYRVRYSAIAKTHVTTFRIGRTSIPQATVVAQVETFLNALAPVRTLDWTVLGADSAGADSELFFPAAPAPAPVAGTQGIGSLARSPVFISFQGRSTAGSRASLYIYGVGLDPVSGEASQLDYRIMTNESVWCTDAVNALNNSTVFTAIDGLPVIWKPYVNVGVNAYYQRKKRG